MKKTLYLGVLFVIALSCTTEQADRLSFIDSSPRGYAQSVVYRTGETNMVFISGQVPVDSSGQVVGQGDLEKQTEQVFENIAAQVRKAGGTMNDVVKINCYFVNIAEISAFRKARDRYINLARPPASTAVQVERLINEDFLIEIDAVAVVDR